MKANTPKDVFIMLLSDVRNTTERSTKIYQEMAALAQDPDVKEALEARAFASTRTLEKLDECFRILQEHPVKLSGRIQDVFIEDFKKEVAEIHSPVARALFILAKANHLTHFRIGEYVALIAAADMTEHYGVGSLLETCLADKMAFVERNRRLIRKLVAAKVGAH